MIAQTLSHKQSSLHALGNLGHVHNAMANYTQASGYYQQQLALAQEIGDALDEAISRGNLGVVAYALGDYEAAFECMTQQLVIVRRLADRPREG